jgi:Protein of unknown function (DUF3592)
MPSTFDAALSGLTALAGLGLLIKGTRDRIKCNRARSWPTAQGRVLDSRLREVRDSEGKTWEVYILYEYWVDGQTYRSNVWRMQAGSSSFTGAAEKAVARYPIGSRVMVYYNPDAPGDAMLEPGKMGWWMFFGGAAFFITGIFAVIHNLQ